MYRSDSDISCGVEQVSDLSDFSDIKSLKSIFDTTDLDILDLPAIIVFSDTTTSKNAPRLAAFIRKNNLGRVTVSPASLNPNSGNMIRVWLWNLNRENLKYLLKHGIKKPIGKPKVSRLFNKILLISFWILSVGRNGRITS